VTAQKTPKSRSADEDAARERERERESATVLACKSELFGVRGGKNPELYVSGMLFLSVSKVSFSFALVFSEEKAHYDIGNVS
jgi:hypothetical protein